MRLFMTKSSDCRQTNKVYHRVEARGASLGQSSPTGDGSWQSRQKLKRCCRTWQWLGVIEESGISWLSLIILIWKKNGDIVSMWLTGNWIMLEGKTLPCQGLMTHWTHLQEPNGSPPRTWIVDIGRLWFILMLRRSWCSRCIKGYGVSRSHLMAFLQHV